MSEPSEMKPNLADRTCELLKWLCNYRKLHNTTTREQLCTALWATSYGSIPSCSLPNHSSDVVNDCCVSTAMMLQWTYVIMYIITEHQWNICSQVLHESTTLYTTMRKTNDMKFTQLYSFCPEMFHGSNIASFTLFTTDPTSSTFLHI